MASSFPSDLADSGLKGLLPLPGMLLLLCSLVLVSVSGAYDDPYRDAGAAWFLAPAADCPEVVGNVPDGLHVARVATFDEARTAVEAIGAGRGQSLPTCTG